LNLFIHVVLPRSLERSDYVSGVREYFEGQLGASVQLEFGHQVQEMLEKMDYETAFLVAHSEIKNGSTMKDRASLLTDLMSCSFENAIELAKEMPFFQYSVAKKQLLFQYQKVGPYND
jgi:hypothetical protein